MASPGAKTTRPVPPLSCLACRCPITTGQAIEPVGHRWVHAACHPSWQDTIAAIRTIKMGGDHVTEPTIGQLAAVREAEQLVARLAERAHSQAAIEAAAAAGLFDQPCGCRRLAVPTGADGWPDYAHATIRHTCTSPASDLLCRPAQ